MRRQFVDDEGRLSVVIRHLAACVMDQVGGAVIAHRDGDQIAGEAVHGLGELTLAGNPGDARADHAPVAARRQSLGDGGLMNDRHAAQGHRVLALTGLRGGTGVDHAGHIDAGIEQVEGDAVTIAIGRHHHGALAGAHAIEADHPLRRRAHHDAGQVVVAEHHGLFIGAGGDDHGGGPELEHAIALEQGQPVVGEPAVAQGVGEDADVIGALDLGDKVGAALGGGLGVGVEAGVVEGAAEGLVLLDQDHLAAALRCLQGRRHAGGPAADHGDIGEQILLVVIAVDGIGVDHAEAGETAEQFFPQPPGRIGLVECLVIEADRHEAGEIAEPGAVIILQAAEHVLGLHHHAGLDGAAVGQHIGLVADLDQAVGVLAAAGQHAARPVIFERARQHQLAVCHQGRGDGVAREACVAAALEGEFDRLFAVDQGAGGGGKPGAAHDSSSCGGAGYAMRSP